MITEEFKNKLTSAMNRGGWGKENMEEVSNCCGAARWMEETDICSDCKEHADFEDEDEYFGITCRNGKPIDQCECC